MTNFEPAPLLIENSSVYGPVTSRRHGISLGVNLGSTLKSCTWNCLYCQYGFGRTVDKNHSDLHTSFRPAEIVYSQILDKLRKNEEITSLTIAGNTEPGLYPHLYSLLKKIKSYQVSARAKWKVVILSNGSELHKDEVVRAFDFADETWIKLDCAIEKDFHALNLPAASSQGLAKQLEHMRKLKKLKIQTMLWNCPTHPEFCNSSAEQLDALFNCFVQLAPQMVQIYTVSRTPAHQRLEPIPAKALKQFALKIKEKGIPCEYYV